MLGQPSAVHRASTLRRATSRHAWCSIEAYVRLQRSAGVKLTLSTGCPSVVMSTSEERREESDGREAWRVGEVLRRTLELLDLRECEERKSGEGGRERPRAERAGEAAGERVV